MKPRWITSFLFCIVLQTFIVQYYRVWSLETLKFTHQGHYRDWAFSGFSHVISNKFFINERGDFYVFLVTSIFVQKIGNLTEVTQWSVETSSSTLQSGLSRK